MNELQRRLAEIKRVVLEGIDGLLAGA